MQNVYVSKFYAVNAVHIRVESRVCSYDRTPGRTKDCPMPSHKMDDDTVCDWININLALSSRFAQMICEPNYT